MTGLVSEMPTPPLCDEASKRETCIDLATIVQYFPELVTAEEGESGDDVSIDQHTRALEACGLSGYVPGNPAEYCCERVCYDAIGCTEESALTIYGQWTADVLGRYESDGAETFKVALMTRDASPQFDPLEFAAEQLAKAASARQTLRVVGNLRHVLAARPVWVIVARSPDDIQADALCADL